MIDEPDEEEKIWEDFLSARSNFKDVTFDFIETDRSVDYVSFGCGYRYPNGEHCDEYNIPAEVFENIFPEYRAEWNAAEQYHMIYHDGRAPEEIVTTVRDRLSGKGFVELKN